MAALPSQIRRPEQQVLYLICKSSAERSFPEQMTLCGAMSSYHSSKAKLDFGFHSLCKYAETLFLRIELRAKGVQWLQWHAVQVFEKDKANKSMPML